MSGFSRTGLVYMIPPHIFIQNDWLGVAISLDNMMLKLCGTVIV
jgi:hypothetical protein